jgi:hypothetical protein
MDKVTEFSRRGASSNTSVGSGGGGGIVDDILGRLRNVERDVSESKAHISAILAVIPHLATKADVVGVKGDIAGVKGDVASVKGELAGLIASTETAIIKWIIATVLASAALAFTIAKFVH